MIVDLHVEHSLFKEQTWNSESNFHLVRNEVSLSDKSISCIGLFRKNNFNENSKCNSLEIGL